MKAAAINEIPPASFQTDRHGPSTDTFMGKGDYAECYYNMCVLCISAKYLN